MDIGDIIRIIFFGIIFLSFFGRFLGRGNAEADADQARPVRPTEMSESGGQEPQPMVGEAHEATFEDAAPAPSQRQREESRKRYQTSTSLPEPVTRPKARREERLERSGDTTGETRQNRNSALAREEALERGPSAGSLMTADGDPGRRPRRPRQATARRQHPATGGDILRRSLKDPDTLERAFIVKEVLDLPIGIRKNAS